MKLGKLEKVNLRDQWKNEANDFTPWLAQEENIALLGEATQMVLEVVRQEESVGPFRADILCQDVSNDKTVLIENQLEWTDHKHLGQIMTYAAGLEAVSIIWISEKFTEEHRAALDWLNRITDESINFFGIEIELFRIGDSPAAPMFNVVSKPNDWAKIVKRERDKGISSETGEFRLEYWTVMKKYIESKGKCSYQLQSPSPKHYTSITLGRTGFRISATVSKRDRFIRIEMLFKREMAKENFKKFKNLYEAETNTYFNNELIWDELPDIITSGIYLKREADTTDKSKWPEQHEWFRVNLEKFYTYFSPKIKAL